MCVGGSIRDISVPSTELCCDLKAALKDSLFFQSMQRHKEIKHNSVILLLEFIHHHNQESVQTLEIALYLVFDLFI